MTRPLPITHDETERVFQCVSEGELRAVLLTSALPGEGTSTIAYALAQRLAASGKSVLLVDFNAASSFAEGTLALERDVWALGCERKPGQPFRIPGSGLAILAAPLGGFAAMASRDEAVLNHALDAWKREYDFVIADAPPLSPKERGGMPTDLLARVFESTILVVLSSATPLAAVKSAIRRLGDAGSTIVGVVLNDKEMPPLRDELTRQVRKLGARFEPLAKLVDNALGRLGLMSVDY